MVTHNLTDKFIIELLGDYAICEPEDIHLDTRLDDLEIDSLDMVELICDIEDHLKIKVPLNANTFEFNSDSKVKHLVAILREQVNAS